VPTHLIICFVYCLVVLAVCGAAQAAPAPLPRTHDRSGEVRLPWELVFRRLLEQTRKPVLAGFIPTGSFRCPKGAWKSPQFIAAVKAALLEHEQPC
jgi:hypothetical protein